MNEVVERWVAQQKQHEKDLRAMLIATVLEANGFPFETSRQASSETADSGEQS